MLESCQSAQERWGGVNLLIDRWLQERQELVKAYAELQNGNQPLAVTAGSLQQFCELLVDYVSAGHFEVYEQLTGEAKAFGDQRGLDCAPHCTMNGPPVSAGVRAPATGVTRARWI